MAKMNYENAGIRSTVSESHFNAKLDDICKKDQKEFSRPPRGESDIKPNILVEALFYGGVVASKLELMEPSEL